MADTDQISPIRRMAGIRAPEPDIPAATLTSVLGFALARAGRSTADLVIKPTEITESRAVLSSLEDEISECDLLALIEGPDSQFGLLVADCHLVASVVEMQTIGRVVASNMPDRSATPTDASLCADFFDRILEGWETETASAGLSENEHVCGFRFAYQLDSFRAATMVLPEVSYQRFTARLDLGDGVKQGAISLFFPVPAAKPIADIPLDGSGEGVTAPSAILLGSKVELHAVLHRVRMPLDDLTNLHEGMTVTLPQDALDAVALDDLSGRQVAICRLGQLKGQRALRMKVAPETGQSRDADASLVQDQDGQQDEISTLPVNSASSPVVNDAIESQRNTG